jgi:S1-C subfamily serine protease
MREQIKKIIKRFSKELILALILAVVAAYAIEIAKEKTKDEILNEARKASATVITYDKNGDPLNEGSGFFISSNGILVTAFHVIEGARDIIAKLPSGAYYDAEKILGARKDIDIAIIQFKAQDTPFVRLGNQNKIKIGQKVYAIGTPGGLEGTISEGIISNPSLKLNDLVFIQHTAPISPGSSGGPLLEDHGRVIGINTKSLKLSYQEGVAQNLNFAVPVNYIKEAIEGKGKLAEGSPDYFYSLGILAENKKDYDKAEEYFKKVISLDKKYRCLHRARFDILR